MILLLGADGYVGQAFASALRRRKNGFVPLAQNTFDYTRFELLFDYVRKLRPELVIDVTGCLDGVEAACRDSVGTVFAHSQTRLALTISRVCFMTKTPLSHVSTDCLYHGGKILDQEGVRIEPNLTLPAIRSLFAEHPERFIGFAESEEPNEFASSLGGSPSRYSMDSVEDMSRKHSQVYVWRMHLPFNQDDDPANYLSHIIEQPIVSDTVNSFSHLNDCVNACLELCERQAPFGIYNIVNPGAVATFEIVHMIQRLLRHSRWSERAVLTPEFTLKARNGEHAHCILDSSKLTRTGIRMRPAKKAFESAIENWKPRLLRFA